MVFSVRFRTFGFSWPKDTKWLKNTVAKVELLSPNKTKFILYTSFFFTLILLLHSCNKYMTPKKNI